MKQNKLTTAVATTGKIHECVEVLAANVHGPAFDLFKKGQKPRRESDRSKYSRATFRQKSKSCKCSPPEYLFAQFIHKRREANVTQVSCILFAALAARRRHVTMCHQTKDHHSRASRE